MRSRSRGRVQNHREVEVRLSTLQSPHPKRRKRRSNAGPNILGILLVAAVLVLISGIVITAIDESPAEPITVTVEEGDTLSKVSGKLKEAGVIHSATLFELEARADGEGRQIKPGKYSFRPGQDADEIMAALTEGEGAPIFALTIPEGLTLEQTAQAVAEQTDVSAAEFETAAKRIDDYSYSFLDDPAIKTTEGFLFPKRYELQEGMGAPQIVDLLLGQYLLEAQDLDFAGARERSGLTEYELVTVASLVEREAANPDEKPLIASVIYNRLEEGIPLQVDAAIQYARGEPKEKLSLEDLEIDSPYNTYKNKGLPPGPISNPSRESIEAALRPADTDYLYFVLDADGKEHYFTEDYEDFLDAKARAGR